MGRELRADTRIHFHKLSWRRRPHDWVVGYEHTGSFTTVEDTGRDLILFLEKHSIGDAQHKFSDYDVNEFVERIAEKGLVHRIGHKRVTNHKHITDILDLNPEKLKWLHNPITVAVFSSIALTGMIMMLADPRLQPTPGWFFAANQLAVVLPVALIFWWLINFMHELAHYATLRATGHEAGFTLVNKWHLLTPHANIQSARLLPTNARIRVLFAGIFSDLTILTFSLFMITIGFVPDLFRLIALLAFVELLFQFTPARHSDVARIIEQKLFITDFNESMKLVMMSGCPFCDKKMDKEAKRVAWMFPFYIMSMLLLAGLVLGYVIPILLRLVYVSARNLVEAAIVVRPDLFVDAVLTLVLLTLGCSFYFASLLRSHSHPQSKLYRWTVVIMHLLADYFAIFLISIALLIYTSPVFASIALFILGIIFGVLILRLLEHANLLEGAARDYLMPILVAVTALLLLILLGLAGNLTGAIEPSALYAIAFAGGMLAATLV